jgi:hypothetical protein
VEDAPRYYTPAEARRVAALLARGSYRTLRGKDTARVDAELDQLRRQARERVAAEDQAVEDARRRKVRERAEQRARRIVR